MRAVRLLARLAAAAALLGAVLFVLLLGVLRSGIANPVLDRVVTALVREEGVFFVKAERISGDLPAQLRVGRLEIGDAYGSWLVLEDAEATWHPFDLLHPFDSMPWRIHVDRVHAARVSWTRLPRKGPDEPDKPLRWELFPRILVDELRVDDLQLSEAMAGGTEQHLRASGSGVLGEWEHGYLRLEAAHTDGRRGGLRIDLRSGGSPVVLEGTVTADEDAGGALAALARLEDGGDVHVELVASGPLTDWRLRARAEASRVGTLQAESLWQFARQRRGQVRVELATKPEWRASWPVPPPAAFELQAHGNWSPDGPAKLEELRLGGGGRRIEARALRDAAGGWSVSADLRGSGTPGFGFVPLDAREAHLEVAGAPHGEAMLRGSFSALDLKAAGWQSGRLDASLLLRRSDSGHEDAALEAEATSTGTRLADALLPVVGDSLGLKVRGRVPADGQGLHVEELRLEGGAAVVQGTLSVEGGWSRLRWALRGDASDLSTLSPAAGSRVEGRAAITLEGSWDPRAGTGDARLEAMGDALAAPEAWWGTLLGPKAVASARLHAAAGEPRGCEVEVQAAGVQGKAGVTMGRDGSGLVADASLQLDAGAAVAAGARPREGGLAGSAQGTVAVRGSLEQCTIDASLEAASLRWGAAGVDAAALTAQAARRSGNWSGKVAGTLRSGQDEASLAAQGSLDGNGSITVDSLSLEAPRTSVAGSMRRKGAASPWEGSLRGRCEDLARWRPVLGMPVAGSLRWDATARDGQVDGSASLRKGGFGSGGDAWSIDAADLALDHAALVGAPKGTIKLSLEGLRTGSFVPASASLAAVGDGERWNVRASATSGNHGPLQLDLAGSLRPGARPEVVLERMQGSAHGVPMALGQRAALRGDPRRPEPWSVDPVELRFGSDGRLSVAANSDGQRASASLQAKALPLAAVGAFVPALDLEGVVDATLRAGRSGEAAPEATLSLQGHGVRARPEGSEGSPAAELRIDAGLAAGRVQGSARVDGADGTRLALHGDAPVSRDDGAAAVAADLRWTGNVASVAAVLPVGDADVGGRMDADLHLSGSLAAPRLSGRASLAGGLLVHDALGLALHDVAAQAVADGTRLELRSLSATDGEGGSVTASGRLAFGRLPAFDARAELHAKRATLVRLDLLTVKADADLELSASRGAEAGARVEGLLRGKVRVDEARFEIPQRFTSDVPDLPVTEVGAVARAEASPVLGAALELDVSVEGDNRLFVSGRGLESEWSTKLRVRGHADEPRVEGTVESVRGQLALLGRRFEVTSGSLRFDGQPSNVPWLAVTAQADANGITAIASLSGPATNPVVELRSEPALPADEVLSRLLFGRSAAGLTPLQSVQLARSLAELSGSPLGTGSGLLSGIGRTLGFDRLDVDSSGADGAAALTASRYLTDNVYLRVQQGLTPESSKLRVEWRVLRHLTIESDVSQDAQGEVGATWRWDY